MNERNKFILWSRYAASKLLDTLFIREFGDRLASSKHPEDLKISVSEYNYFLIWRLTIVSIQVCASPNLFERVITLSSVWSFSRLHERRNRAPGQSRIPLLAPMEKISRGNISLIAKSQSRPTAHTVLTVGWVNLLEAKKVRKRRRNYGMILARFLRRSPPKLGRFFSTWIYTFVLNVWPLSLPRTPHYILVSDRCLLYFNGIFFASYWRKPVRIVLSCGEPRCWRKSFEFARLNVKRVTLGRNPKLSEMLDYLNWVAPHLAIWRESSPRICPQKKKKYSETSVCSFTLRNQEE